MASSSQGRPRAMASLDWLAKKASNSAGGVIDSVNGDEGDTLFSNVAGFAILAQLGTTPPA
jgi:hypothetical protein